MPDTKHTPGPWQINKYGGVGAGQFGINPCIVDSQGWADGNGADMRLIAAAPDLLDAAVFALDIIETHLLELSDGSMATKLRDAIKKAEGR